MDFKIEIEYKDIFENTYTCEQYLDFFDPINIVV